MSNLENLTSKILSEAKLRAEDILADADKESLKIIENKLTEAKKIESDIINKGNREAVTMKERIISNAQLNSRNKKLQAKQIVIDKAFKIALDDLNHMSEQNNIEFIKNRVNSINLNGNYKLIISNKLSKEAVNSLEADLNNSLKIDGKEAKVTIVNNQGEFQGGFILEKEGIEINYTFEALVNSMREDLEYEVVKVLFS